MLKSSQQSIKATRAQANSKQGEKDDSGTVFRNMCTFYSAQNYGSAENKGHSSWNIDFWKPIHQTFSFFR